MKTIFTLIFLVVIAGSGCSEKESPTSCDYEKDYAEFLRQVDLFSDNLTTAQCEEMRKSALKVLQKMRGCPSGVVTTEEALQAWRDTDCSAFDKFLNEEMNVLDQKNAY